jgi:hypothetical protein
LSKIFAFGISRLKAGCKGQDFRLLHRLSLLKRRFPFSKLQNLLMRPKALKTKCNKTKKISSFFSRFCAKFSDDIEKRLYSKPIDRKKEAVAFMKKLTAG